VHKLRWYVRDTWIGVVTVSLVHLLSSPQAICPGYMDASNISSPGSCPYPSCCRSGLPRSTVLSNDSSSPVSHTKKCCILNLKKKTNYFFSLFCISFLNTEHPQEKVCEINRFLTTVCIKIEDENRPLRCSVLSNKYKTNFYGTGTCMAYYIFFKLS
jgi:hypothetical protein